MSSFSRASPTCPDAAAAGAAHAAPSGVQPATRAIAPSTVSPFLAQSMLTSRATSGDSDTITSRAMSAEISRARRVASRNDATEVLTLAASVQVTTMTAAPTTASTAESGVRDQVITCATETIAITSAGTPTNAVMASPVASRPVGMPNSENARGSRVSSTPNASGTRMKQSTMSAPADTATLVATSTVANRSATSASTATNAAPRP